MGLISFASFCSFFFSCLQLLSYHGLCFLACLRVLHDGTMLKYGIQGKFLNVVKSMYSSIRSCVKINQNALTELFSCNKGIRQGDSLSPVLFSLFMNDRPQYFKESKSPGVMLGNRTINELPNVCR